MDLCRSLLKADRSFDMILSFTFLVFKLRIARFAKSIFNQFVFIDKASPPDSYLRDPPLGPTLVSDPAVAPKSPTLGSHLKVPL